jgi:2-octaprenyl-6-methoxyphenol hydroxylase
MTQCTIGAEVAICGGGLNGLAAAVCLSGPGSRLPLETVLIEAGDPSAQASREFDGRASAIAASSKRMLEAMGVWEELAPDAQPVERIVVTDGHIETRARPALLVFGDEAGLGASAHIVENRHLYAALARAAHRLDGVTVVAGAEVESLEADGRGARLALADGRRIEAGLVVAADGRRSRLRSLAGIETLGWSYGQSAIVTAVSHALPHRGCAYEHFLPAGPFAILPLPGNRSSLVWTETTAEAERIAALDEAGFAAELEARFGTRLGEVRAEGPRHVYPLALSVARAFRAARLALVGDAAHVVHPIAGLGFNLGLRDIAALAECLADAVRLGLDPGGPAVLSRYESWRRIDTLMVAAATEGLNRLFSNDNPALRLLRDAGLMAVDALAPLKAAFMREAAGLTGTLPRLLTGRPA